MAVAFPQINRTYSLIIVPSYKKTARIDTFQCIFQKESWPFPLMHEYDCWGKNHLARQGNTYLSKAI